MILTRPVQTQSETKAAAIVVIQGVSLSSLTFRERVRWDKRGSEMLPEVDHKRPFVASLRVHSSNMTSYASIVVQPSRVSQASALIIPSTLTNQKHAHSDSPPTATHTLHLDL